MRIAVIPRTTGTQLWEAEHAGVEAGAKRWNVTLYWNAPTREDDVERQIAMFERAIDQGYDAIVLSPDQPLSLLSSVNRALAHGLRVVVVGSPMPLAAHPGLKQIVNDDSESGRLAARRIGAQLHGHGEVAVLGVDGDLSSLVRRERAFRLELASNSPDVHIVDEEAGAFNRAHVEKTAADIIRTQPRVQAIFALTSEATQGSFAAVQNSGSGLILVGCEQDFAISVTSKEMDSLIVEDTVGMGYQAIQWIMEPGDSNNSDVELKPLLVTKDNLHQKDVQQMLAFYWKQE
ncbi:substrate-binding domain-containing protein [Acidisarcina polymorpha]|nr:substrate-binding domain-containing protein [Acidisarcina polymorpha]